MHWADNYICPATPLRWSGPILILGLGVWGSGPTELMITSACPAFFIVRQSSVVKSRCVSWLLRYGIVVYGVVWNVECCEFWENTATWMTRGCVDNEFSVDNSHLHWIFLLRFCSGQVGCIGIFPAYVKRPPALSEVGLGLGLPVRVRVVFLYMPDYFRFLPKFILTIE